MREHKKYNFVIIMVLVNIYNTVNRWSCDNVTTNIFVLILKPKLETQIYLIITCTKIMKLINKTFFILLNYI